ncbi:hypothetical protein FNV43_RR19657 [Rhamnella rubrinervis]|uniref:Uncharacterized protein n=1 Tax=Rhamnella rubrinervis TaxID=2594499 RepID=A0A8K0DZ76_9ROSA|nr:hypothetical protein FNV43_RR19657 [Rhamnella rubrinervis]
MSRLSVQFLLEARVFNPGRGGKEEKAEHGEQAQELEKKLEAAEREVRELRSDNENQLIIGFELMKATLKTVEPNFVLERLDEANLESFYPTVLAKSQGRPHPKSPQRRGLKRTPCVLKSMPRQAY